MIRVLLDVAVNAFLGSSLVAAQAIVLNRLGIPFAAITAFAGIAAYALALSLAGAFSALMWGLVLSILAIVGFTFLARPLPADRYLLLTIAVLGVFRATAGTVNGLGGQLGLSAASTLLPPQTTLPFAILATCCFAASLWIHLIIGRSQFGLAVCTARIARMDIVARAYLPVRTVTLVCFVIAALLAICVGILQALYSGRVDPNQFRIQTAVILLMPTLAVGSSTWRIGLLSFIFFAFPELFSLLFGYDSSSMAFVREMAWSILIIMMVSRNRLFVREGITSAIITAKGSIAK